MFTTAYRKEVKKLKRRQAILEAKMVACDTQHAGGAVSGDGDLPDGQLADSHGRPAAVFHPVRVGPAV